MMCRSTRGAVGVSCVEKRSEGEKEQSRKCVLVRMMEVKVVEFKYLGSTIQNNWGVKKR